MPLRFRFVLAILLLQPTAARALDPATRLTQYAHTEWRLRDGVFSGAPLSIIQTDDGYIWVGTANGIVQFDGARFVPWAPRSGPQLPNQNVFRMWTTRDRSLWISTRGYLSRWQDGALTNISTGASVQRIAEDPQGTLWAALGTFGGGSRLCRILTPSLQCLEPPKGIAPFRYTALVIDRDGTIWVGGDSNLLRRSQGATVTSAVQPQGLVNHNGVPGIRSLAASPDGSLWVGMSAGPDLGLKRLVNGQWKSVELPGIHGSALTVMYLFRDREGALWIGTAFDGLYRIYGDRVDHIDRATGLSANMVTDIFEDREGNIWVATPDGVDRFADTPLVTMSPLEGFCEDGADTVYASRDGSVWLGGDGLTRIRDGQITCVRTKNELPDRRGVPGITAIFEDHAGRLWLGVNKGLWIFEGGRFQQVTGADGRPIGMITSIAEDVAHHVWITSGQLMRVEGLVAREELPDLPRTVRVIGDPSGGLWLGLGSGDLAHLRDGKATVHKFEHANKVAKIFQMFAEPDGSVIAATNYGLVGWRNGEALTLTQSNGLPCSQVNSMTFDRRGDLWLFMNCALGVLKKDDLQRWKLNPSTTVTISTLDGASSGEPSFVAAARGGDGRLWFTTIPGVQVLNPESLGKNNVPPPVHIEQVIADRVSYSPQGAHLPPRTHDLEIDYVGLSFVAPQKVRFRYRLEGRDDAWQEPGNRRQAFYSDLRPGTYRFHVIASNNDSVWNEEGATLDIAIAPTWYQTRAFQILTIVAMLLTLWLVYRLRMRQIARVLNARFDERLAERTRMARDLHDTLLQTVQGSKMVADSALDHPADSPALARALQQVSNWLGQASEEGRSALNALRTSTTETNDLAEAFRRAIEDCRRHGAIDASLTVTGQAREMHPVVRDEVYRIGYEAIRNAHAHSHGSFLEVSLTYGSDLTLRVADDGVGMESRVAERGRDGHFGMHSMRERAGRIGASLVVNSRPSAGTAIVLTVPGQAIFRKTPSFFVGKIRSVLGRRSETGPLHD
jgi:signal transduction histidine kinase/ligand-binding sensor domain-containing protein